MKLQAVFILTLCLSKSSPSTSLSSSQELSSANRHNAQSMTERRRKTGTCKCNIGSRAYRKFVEVRHETKLPNKYKQKDEKIKAVKKGKDHNQRTIKKIIREEGQTKQPPWLRNTTCKRMLG
ncbi:hypothetical protein YC2023_049439 [Brassica napus]